MSDVELQAPPREVAPVLGLMIVRYVERALGADAAAAVVAALGDGMTVAHLHNDRWYSNDEFLVLAGAAQAVTRDAEIGRRIGEELFRYSVEAGFLDWMRATGSLADAAALVLEYGSKMSSGRLLTPGRATDSDLHFTGTFAEEVREVVGARVYCELVCGYYSQLPTVFGYLGTTVETACQVEGAERCEFLMAWRPDPLVEAPGAVDQSASADRSEGTIAWFERMQAMGSELVAVHDVDGALERILRHVSGALSAPRYLLAVDVGDGVRRVHGIGLTKAEATSLADKLSDVDASPLGGIALAPVSYGDHHFGRLAAVFPRGTRVNEVDQRLLSAYANHAAAALNVIVSLETARRDRDTAQVLLALARSLAEVASQSEIASRICDAVPSVVECNGSSVLLYDAVAAELVLAATSSADSTLPKRRVLPASVFPGVAAMAASPRAVVVDASLVAPELQSDLAAFGVKRVGIVPILSRGSFLGIVCAGFAGETHGAVDEDVLVRLAGLADHAATALENAKLLDKMRQEALHDGTTGLPNRVLIEDRGRDAFERAAATGRSVGLLFIDLDRFKNVNDTLGHHAGDELIRAVADRLHSVMRDGDTLARLGGDEFVVLLPTIAGPDDAVLVANRLIDVLRQPFTISDQELFISCSIGVACSPEHGSSYESLLQYADSAMYSAKAHGRSTFALDAAAVAAPRRQQLRLESQLHRALENDELRVHYQPQVELATGRVVGAEALVRWQHPTEGLLLPGSFLPLAEESGLVVAIDEFVRREAFAQARVWQDRGHELRVTVNVDARTLANPDLAALIADELRSSGAPAHLVELEINEKVAMCDVDELPAALRPLRALGVRIAIDDFGTGSSVLRRLQHCEIDTLKIDRSFIAAVTPESYEVPLIKALLAMANSLELTVVAEGVETAAQARLLERYGCGLAQGWLFSPAVPADEVVGALV